MAMSVRKGLLVGVSAAVCLPAAMADMGTIQSNPVIKSLRRQDCSKAVELLNVGLSAKDSQVAMFLAARMLDEGICVKKDSDGAIRLFARSSELGYRNAGFDYASKVGMGEGEPQDYLRAGDACRSAGLETQGRLSFYSLGYTCTVSGVAGRLLRETLPKGAFRIPTAPAIVEFNPVSSELRITSAPKAERAEPRTGAYLGEPLVDPTRAIKQAWSEALAMVPKPDRSQLVDEFVRLPVDLDMTLEVARTAVPTAADDGNLVPGDLRLNLGSGKLPQQ